MPFYLLVLVKQDYLSWLTLWTLGCHSMTHEILHCLIASKMSSYSWQTGMIHSNDPLVAMFLPPDWNCTSCTQLTEDGHYVSSAFGAKNVFLTRKILVHGLAMKKWHVCSVIVVNKRNVRLWTRFVAFFSAPCLSCPRWFVCHRLLANAKLPRCWNLTVRCKLFAVTRKVLASQINFLESNLTTWCMFCLLPSRLQLTQRPKLPSAKSRRCKLF